MNGNERRKIIIGAVLSGLGIGLSCVVLATLASQEQQQMVADFINSAFEPIRDIIVHNIQHSSVPLEIIKGIAT